MYSLRQLLVALLFVAEFFVVACVSIFLTAFLGLQYDEMHTISTAMNTHPSLTREQVIFNVSVYTIGWSVAALFTAALIFAINGPLLDEIEEFNGKKVAAWFALWCWAWMMFLLFYAGISCYLKYGANSPA